MADLVILSTDSVQKSVEKSNLSSNKLNGESKKHEMGIKCQVDLGSGNTKCCVPNCSTNTLSNSKKSQITFITFPKDPSRFTEWTRALERPDLLTYIGKKEATNLLVCSKHFPENMWVNPTTRIKRLHKNAVPEIDSDEDIDIIAINPSNSSKKGGLKIKKVSSLLTESALRESLTPVTTMNSPMLIPNILDSSSKKSFSARKWPQILPKQKLTGSTELENKLISENETLKSELDKNMDYILNQKAHYEGIVNKEKKRSQELEDKVQTLETSQKKLWHTYESHLQAQRTVVNSKEVGQQEMVTQLKILQQKNDEMDRKFSAYEAKIICLERENLDLEAKIEELTQNESCTTSSPPTEPNFSGEKFKIFLHHCLQKEKLLKEQIEALASEVGRRNNEEGQKSLLLELAGELMNKSRVTWLQFLLNNKEDKRIPGYFRELCLSLYDSSPKAYVVCEKAFGLPQLATVREWARDTKSGTLTSNSMMEALYEEETQPTAMLFKSLERETSSIQESKSKGKTGSKRWKDRSPPPKRKRREEDALEEGGEDSHDEGMVTDEEEEILFSEDSDEEATFSSNLDSDAKLFELPEASSLSVASPPPPPPPPPPSTQANFDFMLDPEEEEEEDDGSESLSHPSASLQLGNSMPLLVPDSPLPSLGTQTGPGVKLAGRKKVISADANLNSGPKVVFRVIE